MKAVYQNRTGVFAEHRKMEFMGSFPADVRMTIVARELLEKASEGAVENGQYVFRTPPQGLAVVLAPAPNGRNGFTVAVRAEYEPEYPGESAERSYCYWEQASLLPCPKCGAALVWYEAGYVAGYRVCAGKTHHHVMIK